MEVSAKICKVSEQGFWISKNDVEYFISFADYPVLGGASISDLSFYIEEPDGSLYWERLDVKIRLQ